MTDLGTHLYLAVNIVSADDLNDFWAIQQSCEPLQGFGHIQIIKFHLDQQPRFVVTRNKGIDFTFFPVSDIPEFKLTDTEIRPAMASLQQMGENKNKGRP